MPKGNEETRFKPGNKLGKGAPRVPEEIKELRMLTKAEAMAALSDVLKLNLEELEILVKDRTVPALKQWAARIALHGIKQGDQRRLDFMFDRLVGKVPQPTEIEIKQPKPVVIEYLDGDKTYLGPPIEEKNE